MRNALMPGLALLAGIAAQWLEIPTPQAGIWGLLALGTGIWIYAKRLERRNGDES